MKVIKRISIFLILISLIFISFYGFQKNRQSIKISNELIEKYLMNIQKNNFDDAFQFSSFSKEDIENAWQNHFEIFGNLLRWEFAKTITENNIFENDEKIRVNVHLYFSHSKEQIFLVFYVKKIKGKFKISKSVRLNNNIYLGEIW